MTGDDHTDALIAALRSPALPSEHAGEAAAVTAMIDALSADPAPPTGRRSRRAVAIAAVTVASLGVGGLVAAGPGIFFLPAADQPSEQAPGPRGDGEDVSTTVRDVLDGTPPVTLPTRPSPTTTAAPPAERSSPTALPTDTTTDDDCDEATHGEAVSDEARSGEPGSVRDVATSDCGKPDEATAETPSSTAPGRTGETPAITAPGRTGETPADTAPGQTGESPSDTAPGQTGESPSDTAPGQTDDASTDEDPVGNVDSPSDTAPGRAGDDRPGGGRP
ncbi:MAG: hypothetical protein ACLGHQ_02175 [Acidimicrobiia bacterium]